MIFDFVYVTNSEDSDTDRTSLKTRTIKMPFFFMGLRYVLNTGRVLLVTHLHYLIYSPYLKKI